MRYNNNLTLEDNENSHELKFKKKISITLKLEQSLKDFSRVQFSYAG